MTKGVRWRPEAGESQQGILELTRVVGAGEDLGMKTMTAKTTRRRFLTSAGAAFGMPMIIPASALGKGGRPAPSERIQLACFGYGTIAQYVTQNFLNDERVQVTCVADPVSELPHYGYSGERTGGRDVGKRVIEEHYAKEKRAGFKGCKTYVDYRELLEREDVDAVQISTPDHWHALLAIACARRGKHIYGQKPFALTVEEGRAIVDEVAKAGVTWQTGSQQRSDVYFRQAAEYVRNQRLGNLETIRVGLPGGHRDFSGQAANTKVVKAPREMDFDLWTGPAPERDYRGSLMPLNWRWNFDFSGGQVTDWGAHHIDIVQWALGMDESGPVQIDIKAFDLPDDGDLYNTAKTWRFEATYADGTVMEVTDAGQNPQGIRFAGDAGKSIFVKRGKIETEPKDLRRIDRIGEGDVRLYESRAHEGNFIDCIYSGEPTVAPAEAAHRTITVAHLANIAMRLGRTTLKWDPAKEQVIGDDKANAMLGREMRKPWSLEGA